MCCVNMICERYLFFALAIIPLSNTVKVNMQGSLGIGKDVMETIEHFISKNFMNGRRFMSTFQHGEGENHISSLVTSASLCEGYSFCDKTLPKYLNEYVMQMAKSIQNIFHEIRNDKSKTSTMNAKDDMPLFLDELKRCIRSLKKILKSADEKITSDNKLYIWTDIAKRITAVFQNSALLFLAQQLQGDPKVMLEVRKTLMQKLVTSTILLEKKFMNQLCVSQNLCTKSVVCTKALNTVLEQFKDMHEGKVKEFVTAFHDVLPDTRFLDQLNDVTAHEFQRVLNDMSYSDIVSAKNILLPIQRIVEDRLRSVRSDTYVTGGDDVELVHVILSDVDHIYSQGLEDAFNNFLTTYFGWIKEGKRLNASLRQVMRNIGHQIDQQSEKLAFKLINEVKVFLELTVDPEKLL